jgi:hypothetical protein
MKVILLLILLTIPHFVEAALALYPSSDVMDPITHYPDSSTLGTSEVLAVEINGPESVCDQRDASKPKLRWEVLPNFITNPSEAIFNPIHPEGPTMGVASIPEASTTLSVILFGALFLRRRVKQNCL